MGQFLKQHPNLELFHVQFGYQHESPIDVKQQVTFGLKHDKLRSLRFPVMKHSITRDELEQLLWSFPNIESLTVLTVFKYPDIWYNDQLMAYFKPRWPKSLQTIHIGSYVGLGPLRLDSYSPFRGESALNWLQITAGANAPDPERALRPVSNTSGSTRGGEQHLEQAMWVPGQTVPASHLRALAQAQLFDHLSGADTGADAPDPRRA